MERKRLLKVITEGNPTPLIDYNSFGREAKLAIPTLEHHLPLLYSMASRRISDNVSFFNDKAVARSLTMNSVKIG